MWRKNPIPSGLWEREGPAFAPVCEESAACVAGFSAKGGVARPTTHLASYQGFYKCATRRFPDVLLNVCYAPNVCYDPSTTSIPRPAMPSAAQQGSSSDEPPPHVIGTRSSC